MFDKLANAVGLGGNNPLQQANTITTSSGQSGMLAANPYIVPGGYGAQLGSGYTDEMLINMQVAVADNGFVLRCGRRSLIATDLETLVEKFTSVMAEAMLSRTDK